MKLRPLFIMAALAAAPAFAADPKKPDPKKPVAQKPEPAKKSVPAKKQRTDMIEEDTVALLKPYDTNGDFEIDLEEFKAIEAAFKKNPQGPFKAFDKAGDGTLDAMIDRTGLNVKLGAAAPKTKPKTAPPARKPAPPAPEKKPAEKKPAA